MRKYYLLALLICIAYLPLTYAGSFNGIIQNNTDTQLCVYIDRSSGTWYGPGQSPEGNNPTMNPNTQAGYTLDSTQGAAQANIIVAKGTDCSNPITNPTSYYCKFELEFSDFSSWQYSSKVYDQKDFQCSVPEINNCDSCINLVINPSSSSVKK